MKNTTQQTTTSLTPRIHIEREDRAPTNAGKTADSKIRSEGRTLAAMERSAIASRTHKAQETKLAVQ